MEIQPTILHVDDYLPGRYARTKILREAGFTVFEAGSGQEALRMAVECRPQLAILDVNLPDIDGFEVCRRIKAEPATAGIVIVQLSAVKVTPSDQVEGLETGADAYLVEPVQPEVLVATIRAMLRAQQAEQAMGLITAQEEERRRIARELHDDVGQRLAALVIDVEGLQKKFAKDSDLASSLQCIAAQVHSISESVGAVSHNLHPTLLDDLGLEIAIRGLAGEFKRTYGMRISLACDGLNQKLPAGVCTALYRIAQEALRNVSKHAPGAPVSVLLETTERCVRLLIEDGGPGFRVDAPRPGGALGLVSMRERARLAGGRFSISSEPGSGTTIEVFVRLVGAARA